MARTRSGYAGRRRRTAIELPYARGVLRVWAESIISACGDDKAVAERKISRPTSVVLALSVAGEESPRRTRERGMSRGVMTEALVAAASERGR